MRIPTFTPKRIALAGTAASLAVGAAIVLWSSGSSARRGMVYDMAMRSVTSPKLEADLAPHGIDAAGSSGGDASPAVLPQKLIHRAKFTLEVVRLDEAARHLESLAHLHGGYLAQAEVMRDEGERGKHHLSLRFPSEHFDAALMRLRSEGRVMQESLSAEDVSRAYVDLEARIRNKRVAQVRLRDILLHRTGRIAEVVEAEQALTQVSEEIERMEAQRRHYDEESAFCTVEVDLELPQVPMATPSPWAPVEDSLAHSAVALRESAMTLLQLLAFLLPWSVLAAGGWLLIRSRRRARLQEAP